MVVLFDVALLILRDADLVSGLERYTGPDPYNSEAACAVPT